MMETLYLLAFIMAPAVVFWLYCEHKATVDAAYNQNAWRAMGVVLLIALAILAVAKLPELQIG